ncbi:hypothetical protein RJ55_04539 [Drechmeria coniospora]|nr:hypothetical protein RJ55_04539 [Drechmeria coniospora]
MLDFEKNLVEINEQLDWHEDMKAQLEADPSSEEKDRSRELLRRHLKLTIDLLFVRTDRMLSLDKKLVEAETEQRMLEEKIREQDSASS